MNRVALVVLLVTLAGCFSSSDGGDTAPVEPEPQEPVDDGGQIPEHPSHDEEPPAPAEGFGGVFGFVRDPSGAVAGATVMVVSTRDSTTSGNDGAYELNMVPAGSQQIQASHGERSATVTVNVEDGQDELVFIDLAAIEQEVEGVPEIVIPQTNTFTCPDGEVEETYPTFGSNDLYVWAAMKTGFRAVVAWQSDLPEIGVLEYSVGGQPYQTATELVPTTAHLFVLDDLDIGATFCFHGTDGALHAMRLGNAVNGYDAINDVYTANLLILANEGSDQNELEDGLDYFAELLWDGTDGHVRSGMNIVVYGKYDKHNSGWGSCYVGWLLVGDGPTCNRVYDVIFTLDAFPGGAASTYRDGIGDPDAAMWMNWYWQAPPGSSIFALDDVGNVLTHEMGHYMLGMMDMYPPTGSNNNGRCWSDAHEFSIMGGSRASTEYDDAHLNRCPNEKEIVEDRGAYVPSWTDMISRYVEIPDRTTLPDPGPDGNGDVYQLHRIEFP